MGVGEGEYGKGERGEGVKFDCKQCGCCCGPVPITKPELMVLQAGIDLISQEERDRIKSQHRDLLTCILLDLETNRCSVYNYRPLVCRQYGQVRELQCPNNQGLKLKSGKKEIMQISRYDIAGILGMNLGWKELESHDLRQTKISIQEAQSSKQNYRAIGLYSQNV